MSGAAPERVCSHGPFPVLASEPLACVACRPREEVSIVLTVAQAGALVGAIDSLDRLAAVLETANRQGARVVLDPTGSDAGKISRGAMGPLTEARATIERAIRHGGGGRPL